MQGGKQTHVTCTKHPHPENSREGKVGGGTTPVQKKNTPPQGRRRAETQISHTFKYVAQQGKRGREEGVQIEPRM